MARLSISSAIGAALAPCRRMGQHARPVQFAHSFPAAAELQLSPKTVSTFRTRILRKMRLHSNAELIRYTVEHELT